MTKWIDLSPSTFSPAPGPVPAPDYWCTPWTVWTPGPDAPKFYLERDLRYTIQVPEGKKAIRMELRFIGYRKKNWMDNMVDTEVNGPGFYETGVNWVTDQRELTSDSGTCTAGWYKYHFTPRSNVTLLMTDRKGDARFVATHVLLEVEDGPATSTPTPVGNPPPPTQVVPPTSSGDPTPPPSPSPSPSTSQGTPTPTAVPGTDLPGGGPVTTRTTTRTGATLSVSNSIGASDSLSTDTSSTAPNIPTELPGDDAPSSRSRSGLLGLVALGCMAIIASF